MDRSEQLRRRRSLAEETMSAGYCRYCGNRNDGSDICDDCMARADERER